MTSVQNGGQSEEGSEQVLQPGQLIRPTLDDDTAIRLVLKLFTFTVTKIQPLPSYDDKNYLVTVDSSHSNPHMQEIWPHGYVLKILNSLDSQKQHVDAEHEMMRILKHNGINCPQPVTNIHNKQTSLEKIYTTTTATTTTGNEYNLHIVRLLTFIPGQRIVTVPYTTELLFSAGQCLGAIDKALQGFSHSALTKYNTIWSLGSVPQLRQFMYAINDVTNRQIVDDVISQFEQQVVPLILQLPQGVIHGDFNEQNIIVEPQTTTTTTTTTAGQLQHNTELIDPSTPTVYHIAGIIDFGDAHWSPYVFEVAIVIMYMMLDSKIVDTVDVGGHVLAGYLSQRSLTAVECQLLKTCVVARYAQSLTLGAYSYSLDPGNEYLLVTAARGWSQLRMLHSLQEQELYYRWKQILELYGLENNF